MPATYENSEIRFLYPENWVLSEEDPDEWPRSISLQSPASGFWSLHVYPTKENAHKLALDARNALMEAYEEVESEEVYEKFGPVDAVGYNLDFIFLDFVVRAEVRGFSRAGRTCVVLCQAETREFDEMAAVFRAITLSLLQP